MNNLSEINNSASTEYKLLIFDGRFPESNFRGFRAIEFESYLNKVENSYIVNIPSGLKDDDYHIGRDSITYIQNTSKYILSHPQYANKFIEFDSKNSQKADLAYILFLNETFTILDYLETHNISFVFCLYPGGGFFVDKTRSDEKLKRIFLSPLFKQVIVTQQYTKDYILRKQLCDESKITLKYGGFSQFEKKDILARKYYPQDKNTFDICFVAFRYVEFGLNKGYDLFIDTAKILSEKISNIRFHIVGNWDKNEIDISTLGNKIIFYGAQNSNFFPEFFSNMDIFLTPNRPLQFGSQFDGFPLGADAGYCGVPIFTSDELNMNKDYLFGKEIVKIPLDALQISNIIIEYYNDPKKLIELSIFGQKRIQELFDTFNQIEVRVNTFEAAINSTFEPKKLTQSDKYFLVKFKSKRKIVFIKRKIYKKFKLVRLSVLARKG
ncbi:MAG: glycosyltransferase family 4 protein [Sulfuricurvum sp.]|nr:glycosyltransferase family 4 protein [Sulfuricurvum sp.]MDD5385940.1 glycosyltransferase family 4 protein [Sulfuricurvum sp.]